MDIMNLSGEKGARELVKSNENSVLGIICHEVGFSTIWMFHLT